MQRLVETLDASTRWHKLRRLGASRLVSLTVLMPVFGYIILLNDNIGPWLQLQAPLITSEKLPFSGWKILCLFYGTFVLAAAALFYKGTVPDLIRDYGSPVTFIQTEMPISTASGPYEYLLARVKRARSGATARQIRLHELSDIDGVISTGLPSSGGAAHPDQLHRLMASLWHLEDTGFFPARLLAGFLFLTGSLLVLAPSAATFWAVTTTSIRVIGR